jgi:hypothetical protein
VFIFCRLKINHDSHGFILESGTVANNYVLAVDYVMAGGYVIAEDYVMAGDFLMVKDYETAGDYSPEGELKK